MSLAMKTESHTYRSIGLSLVGFVLLIAAAVMLFSIIKKQPTVQPTDVVYQYKINQSVDSGVTYRQSSFFEDGPGLKNDAFVADLTDMVKSTFHYRYTGSKPATVTYDYDVKAIVRGTYSLKSDDEAAANVWSKEYQLVEPTRLTETGTTFSVDPSVEIPYQKYKAAIEQFRMSLALPISTEMIITFSMRASGAVDGMDFKDVRTATVSAPFNQQIYKLAVKYDKEDAKFVAPPEEKASWRLADNYDTIFAVVMGLFGLTLVVYGLRSRIFRTPYQRELDKIYRYHDGIIIRASRPTNLDGKNIVPVLSFDDLLNLEEELKVPIVANPVGTEATQFLIVRDDVAYAYTLGKVLIERETMSEVEESIEADELIAPLQKRTSKKTSRRIKKIQ